MVYFGLESKKINVVSEKKSLGVVDVEQSPDSGYVTWNNGIKVPVEFIDKQQVEQD